MAGQRRRVKDTPSAEERSTPSAEERKGKRGHDGQGNVRPADGRYELHDPKDESKYVRTETAKED